jgi:hypothetical protein
MLVVCNGAFKSGSTWLYETVRALVSPQPLPADYVNDDWLPVESIAPRRMRRFLRDVDIHGNDFVVKQHMNRVHDRRLLDGRPEVRVVDVQRDVRDVVVSSYFHFEAGIRPYGDFEMFYWSQGRYIADGVLRHHRVWRDSSALVLGYEQMTDDWRAELGRLAAFLGLEPTPTLVDAVDATVALPRLRKKYAASGISGMSSTSFFRRGGSGAWREHFDAAMLRDLEAIMASGLPLTQRLRWTARIRARRFRLARSWRAAKVSATNAS